jgi:hypothetical protein
MTRACDKGVKREELYTRVMKDLMYLCPPGRDLDLHTESAFLIEETDKMQQHAVSGSSNLSWDETPHYWQEIWKRMCEGGKRLRVQKQADGERPRFEAALAKSAEEMVRSQEEKDRGHPDFGQGEAPWS